MNYAPPDYLRIEKRWNAKDRLHVLRRAFVRCPAPGMSWRDARKYGFRNWESAYCVLSQGFNGDVPVWYCHTGAQFRDEQYADDVCPHLKHKGWYADADASETIRGIVGLLTHGRFIAGYESSDSGERVYFNRVFDEARDAALFADESARVYAEDQRIDSEKQREAQDLEATIMQQKDRLSELLVLRNHPRFPRARDDAWELIDSIRANEERLSTDYEGVI